MTTNKKVIDFINETKALCQPDNIVWIDGSEEQLEALRAQAVEEKILKLQESKKELADAVITGENISLSKLSKEELSDLFSTDDI